MADQQSFQQQYLKSDVETKRLFRTNQARWNKKKEMQLEMLLKEHVMASPKEPMAIPGGEENLNGLLQ